MRKNYKIQQIKLKNKKIIDLNLELKKLEFEKEKILNENNISHTILFGILSILLGFIINEVMTTKTNSEIGIEIFSKIIFLIIVFVISIILYSKTLKPSFKEISTINKKIEVKNKELLEIIYK